MMLTYYWAHRNNISHCVAPFNPALTRVMQRIGFEKIGDVVQSHHHDLAIQPMKINMLEVRKSFIDFVERQAFIGFMEPFFREYFDDGEVVVLADHKICVGDHTVWSTRSVGVWTRPNVHLVG